MNQQPLEGLQQQQQRQQLQQQLLLHLLVSLKNDTTSIVKQD